MGTRRPRKKNGHVAPQDEPRLPVPIRDDGDSRRRRISTTKRRTSTLDVTVAIDLDGSGRAEASTSDPRLNQMLETLAAESLFDLKVVVRGGGSSAQQYGEIGAALGRAFVEALGEHSGVEAVGSATVATLDAVMSTYVDLGRGPYSSFKVSKRSDELDLLDVFSSELASESGLTLHLVEESGENRSRIFECAARAMGRALLMASRTDDRRRRSM